MSGGRLVELAEALERQGVHAIRLRALQDELDAIEAPGMLSRLSAATRDAAARHWRHVVGELQESAEVLGILQRRVSGRAPLTDEEVDKVRGQLGDLLRVVPAGLVALANSAFPVPGTGLLTPWLLCRLGLMPSRWREAHLLGELQREEERMRAAGLGSAADQVQALADALEDEANAREEAAREAALLTFWDADANGVLDEQERAAYALQVRRLQEQLPRLRAQRRWFLRIDDHLFGPCRLGELPDLPPHSLVSLGGASGWVAVHDLLSPTALPPAQDAAGRALSNEGMS